MIKGPYDGRVVDVHDGDTIHIDLDLGYGVLLAAYDLKGKPQLSCRAYGINAPELTKDGHPNQPGIDALNYAMTLLEPGDMVSVLSHGWDKYGGRYDGQITMPDGRDFSEVMLANGHAVLFKGLHSRQGRVQRQHG